MEKLTKQDVLELVYTNYYNGGKNGWDNSKSTCVYFAKETSGNCAVGVLLKHLGLNVEDLVGQFGNHNSGATVLGLLGNCENIKKIFSERLEDVYENLKDGSFLTRLQKAHDRPAQDAHRFALSEEESRTNLLYSLRRFATDSYICLDTMTENLAKNSQ